MANNIGYTCKYVAPFDRDGAQKQRADAMHAKMVELEDHLRVCREHMQSCLNELNYALTGVTCAEAKLKEARLEYDIIMQQQRTEFIDVTSLLDDDFTDDVFDDLTIDKMLEEQGLCILDDDVCLPNRFSGKVGKTRKTKHDILSPEEACKIGKASKRHKLTVKKHSGVDATKTRDAGRLSACIARRTRSACALP